MGGRKQRAYFFRCLPESAILTEHNEEEKVRDVANGKNSMQAISKWFPVFLLFTTAPAFKSDQLV